MQKEHALKIATKLLIEPLIQARYFVNNEKDYYSAVHWLWCSNILWDGICKNNMFDLSIDEVEEAYKIMVNEEITEYLTEDEYLEEFKNERIKELLHHVTKWDVLKTYSKDEIQGAFFEESQLMLEKFSRFVYSDMDFNRTLWNMQKIPKEILVLENVGLLTKTEDGNHWYLTRNKDCKPTGDYRGKWFKCAVKALKEADLPEPVWTSLNKLITRKNGIPYSGDNGLVTKVKSF